MKNNEELDGTATPMRLLQYALRLLRQIDAENDEEQNNDVDVPLVRVAIRNLEVKRIRVRIQPLLPPRRLHERRSDEQE